MATKTEIQQIQDKINNIKRVNNKKYLIPWLSKFVKDTEVIATVTIAAALGAIVAGSLTGIVDILEFGLSGAYVSAGLWGINTVLAVTNVIVHIVRRNKELKKLGVKPKQAEKEIERLKEQLSKVKTQELAKAKGVIKSTSKNESGISKRLFAEAEKKLALELADVAAAMAETKTQKEAAKLDAKYENLLAEQTALYNQYKSSTR